MCFFSGEDLSTFFNGDRNCRSAQGYFKETYSIPWETLDKRHFMHRLAPRCGWALKFKLTLPSGAGERVQCLSHKDTVTGYTFAAAVQPVIWLSQKTLCFLPKCVCVWHWDFSQFDHEASPKGSQKTSEGGPTSLEVSGLSVFYADDVILCFISTLEWFAALQPGWESTSHEDWGRGSLLWDGGLIASSSERVFLVLSESDAKMEHEMSSCSDANVVLDCCGDGAELEVKAPDSSIDLRCNPRFELQVVTEGMKSRVQAAEVSFLRQVQL